MRYAIIENGTVKNIVLSDANYASEQGWVSCPNHDDDGNSIDIGFNYSNGKFTKPLRNIDAEWIMIRRTRNLLITQTDWTQGADVPQLVKDKWAPYRQALRDIPQKFTDPQKVIWPTQPE